MESATFESTLGLVQRLRHGGQPDLADIAQDLVDALKVAEVVLSYRPYSDRIWPNGMHPFTGIELIRNALKKAGEQP